MSQRVAILVQLRCTFIHTLKGLQLTSPVKFVYAANSQNKCCLFASEMVVKGHLGGLCPFVLSHDWAKQVSDDSDVLNMRVL